jgi:hypothetical protein
MKPETFDDCMSKWVNNPIWSRFLIEEVGIQEDCEEDDLTYAILILESWLRGAFDESNKPEQLLILANHGATIAIKYVSGRNPPASIKLTPVKKIKQTTSPDLF